MELFLILGLLIAISYFIAGWKNLQTIQKILKALPLICWIIAIFFSDFPLNGFPLLLFMGLFCSVAGDLFLLTDQKYFLHGLSSFFITHLFYIFAFLIEKKSDFSFHSSSFFLFVCLVILALSYIRYLRLRLPQHHGSVLFNVAVYAYIFVISSMVYTAWLTKQPLLIFGAFLFYLSDFILSWNKFICVIKNADFFIMLTYYGAQFCFVSPLLLCINNS